MVINKLIKSSIKNPLSNKPSSNKPSLINRLMGSSVKVGLVAGIPQEPPKEERKISKQELMNSLMSGSIQLNHLDIETIYGWCGRKIREHHESHLI